MVIARKTNTDNPWLAWIPIANIYILVKSAGRPGWWLLLFLVPLVNIIITVLIWMDISKKMGKDKWLGILIIIPLIGFILPGYLAFSGN
jgi:uncharacterized membrane protein YhaH (DUF805 family)